MVVWVLVRDRGYDGQEVFGVFEKEREAVDVAMANLDPDHHQFVITPWRLGSDLAASRPLGPERVIQ